MSNRLVNTLLIISLACIAALFVTNLIPILWSPRYEKFITYADVRGVSVEYNKKPWTLNLKQQTQLIDYLNQAITVKKETLKQQGGLPFESITIYRFKGGDIVLKPLGKNNKNIVFSAPQWAADSYLQDVSAGEMLNLIQKTYDP